MIPSPTPKIAPLPRKEEARVARRTMQQLLLGYTVVIMIGLWLAVDVEPLALRIFGLGMLFPSAGFLAHADVVTLSGWVHIVMTLMGLVAFGLSVVVWFAMGNVLAPPLTWLVLALAAASMTHQHHFSLTPVWISVGLIVGAALFLWLIFNVRQRRGHRARAALNTWLQESAPAIVVSFPSQKDTVLEMPEADVRRMRFLLDRALQPITQFEGFEWLDQFQTAAVRYQLNFMGYALSMMQYRYLPACRATIQEAQTRLICKLTDPRVWRYWELENLWGNLSINPDPVATENIMFTGFAATQMVMHHAASGTQPYAQPESFTLQHPKGMRWIHSLPSLVERMVAQMDASPYHLMACEPNWIYPLCNMIGAAAIKAHAPQEWQRQQARFRAALEQEFMDGCGRIIACRSRYTGLPFPMLGGAMPQALPCLFLNALWPELALRQWMLLRRTIMEGNRLKREKFWRIDTGNYRFSRAAAYSATALAAAEMGDEEVRSACFEALEEECSCARMKGIFTVRALQCGRMRWNALLAVMHRMDFAASSRRLILSFRNPISTMCLTPKCS
jgi:hypothetical protein